MGISYYNSILHMLITSLQLFNFMYMEGKTFMEYL